jgi:predicted DCC family thiol-disulfide oxidoreductase YuxK
MASAILVYDSDCGFCTKSVTFIGRLGSPVSAQPWQSIPDLAAIGLTESQVMEAAYLLDGDAKYAGSDAIGYALSLSRHWPVRVVGPVIVSRVVRPIARRVYSLIAANRYRMPGSTGTCRLPS